MKLVQANVMQYWIDYIKNIIRIPFFGKAVGVAALLILIWYGGVKVGLISPWYRLAIIALLLLLFAFLLILKWFWAVVKGHNLQKHLQSQQENLAGRQLEIELLKENMARAIAALKSSELGIKYRGNSALYALPWYMIIGPSASGKSTLLRNSGLHFPLTSSEDIQVQGFGGTRNCDWCFSDEAILLDTAGRYTTETDDHEEWLSFLQLLNKYRPRQPLNGVILTISLTDILTSDEKAISRHVKIIRARISELYHHLGFIFPVYLILTKCDLLKGFNHFFADLNDTERQQIWGVAIKDDEVEQELYNLYVKLTYLRLHKLAIERNLKRKIAIYDFPEQFQAIINKITNFIHRLCHDNPYQEQLYLYGVYFTSGTQHGTPIQRLLGNIQQAFTYSECSNNENNQQSNSHDVLELQKSYFIKELFHAVIIPNKYAAIKTKSKLELQRNFKALTYVSCIATIVIACTLFSIALTQNMLILQHGKNTVTDLTKLVSQNDLTQTETANALLPAFNYYQLLLEKHGKIPFYLRLGLYRGDDLLQPLNNILFQAIKFILIKPIHHKLLSQLSKMNELWPKLNPKQRNQLRGIYYSTLKNYLMLKFPNHLNISDAAPFLTLVWVRALTDDNQLITNQLNDNNYQLLQTANHYKKLILFFLRHLQSQSNSTLSLTMQTTTAYSTDKELIISARQQLQTSSLAENIYAQISSSGLTQLKPLHLQDMTQGSSNNLLISNHYVPGIYTRKGWKRYIKPNITTAIKTAKQENWVLATPFAQLQQKSSQKQNHHKTDIKDKIKLTQEIYDIYYHKYIQTWFNFLTSIHIQKFASLQDANNKLTLLASTDGPLAQLLHNVCNNLQIPMIRKNNGELLTLLQPTLKDTVSNSIKAYLHELIQLQNDLQQITASPNIHQAAQRYTSKILQGSGENTQLYRTMIATNMLINQLNNPQAKHALKSLLQQPIQNTWQAILNVAKTGLEQQWQAQVLSYYKQNIANKFPFSPTAQVDVSPSVVNSFFKPQSGVLWRFANTKLKPYLYHNSTGWHEHKWLSVGVNFSDKFIRSLTQLQDISQALFINNNNQLNFNYQIYPEPTPGISKIMLSSNGQSLRYQNGPQQWQTFHWSTQVTNQTSQLTAIASNGNSPNTLQFSGQWSLFHLISKANLQHMNNNIYRVTWNLTSIGKLYYKISFLLRTDNETNLFAALLTNQLTLPQNIFNPNG